MILIMQMTVLQTGICCRMKVVVPIIKKFIVAFQFMQIVKQILDLCTILFLHSSLFINLLDLMRKGLQVQ